MNKFYILGFLFLVFFGVWEVSARFFMEHRFVFPAPSKVFLRLWEQPERFWFHGKETFKEMFLGMGLAFISAFPLAWLMHRFTSANLILQPILILLQCIPMFTLAPLMILWFGWTASAIIVSTALMIFFPLLMNIYKGIQSVPSEFRDYFKIHQATSWQKFWKLELPWAKPYIFSGLRISTAIAGTGAIAGEWAGAQAGLGLLMQESRRATDLETTFGAILCLALLSALFYGLIMVLEGMMNKSRLIQKFTALIFATTIFSGCQTESSAEIKVLLDWLPNPNHIPLYVGIDQGYFASKNIPLRILKLQDPSDSIPLVSSKKVDIALYYLPQTLRANQRGADLTAIAVLIDQPLNCFLFRKEDGLTDLAQLEGRKIGYCIDGTEGTELDYILSSNGVDLAKIEKKNVSFDFVSSLGTKQVDAVFGAYWNIEGAHLKSLGIDTDYIPLSHLNYPNYYELIFVTSQTSSYHNEPFVADFQKALEQSIQFCKEFPEKAFTIYALQNPDKSRETLQWEKEAWYQTLPALASTTRPDQVMIKRYAETQKHFSSP